MVFELSKKMVSNLDKLGIVQDLFEKLLWSVAIIVEKPQNHATEIKKEFNTSNDERIERAVNNKLKTSFPKTYEATTSREFQRNHPSTLLRTKNRSRRLEPIY